MNSILVPVNFEARDVSILASVFSETKDLEFKEVLSKILREVSRQVVITEKTVKQIKMCNPLSEIN